MRLYRYKLNPNIYGYIHQTIHNGMEDGWAGHYVHRMKCYDVGEEDAFDDVCVGYEFDRRWEVVDDPYMLKLVKMMHL